MVAVNLFELRAWHAGGNTLDVGQYGPGPIDWQGKIKFMFELHRDSLGHAFAGTDGAVAHLHRGSVRFEPLTAGVVSFHIRLCI
jgi:hypothetical protein